MDIHIEGQRITAIVRRDRLPLPDQVVDARERTVVPGFIDVHVHHAGAGSRLGAQWLRHGVTTVREVDAPLLPAIERAEAWASGRRPGPRLVIVPTQMVPDFAAREPVVIQTDQAISQGFAHAAASRRARAGLDAEWPRGWPILATAEIELSPLSLSYQDTIGRLLASGRFVATGLAAALVIEHENAAATGQALGATLGRLTRSSARIAIASDAPVVAYGSGYHDELAALAEAGVPPAQILRWASAGGAMALGLDQQLGTLEPGKLADFLVIDGDPLTRIEEAARIELTVVGGVRYAPAALE